MLKIISKMLVVPDLHFPHVDQKAVNKVIKLHANEVFDEIVFTGDILDNDNFSRFSNDPRLITDFPTAVSMAVDTLTRFRRVSNQTVIRVKSGNHDERITKCAARMAPELLKAGMIKTFPEILQLDKLNIIFHEYNEKVVLRGNLKVTHGSVVRPLSGYAAHAEIRRAGKCSGISGHTHRLCWVKYLDQTWLECGNLCTKDYAEFLYLADAEADWHQGFATGYLVQKTSKHGRVLDEYWIMNPVEIRHGSFIYNGVLY